MGSGLQTVLVGLRLPLKQWDDGVAKKASRDVQCGISDPAVSPMWGVMFHSRRPVPGWTLPRRLLSEEVHWRPRNSVMGKLQRSQRPDSGEIRGLILRESCLRKLGSAGSLSVKVALWEVTKRKIDP